MDLETLRKIESKQVQIIGNFLIERMSEDNLLKQKLLETEKTLEGCLNYVKSQAKKQAEDNMAWIADDVVFGWVLDYYLDDSIEENKVPKNSTEAMQTNKPKVEKVNKPIKQEKPKPAPRTEAKPIKTSKEDQIKQKLYGEMDLFSI